MSSNTVANKPGNKTGNKPGNSTDNKPGNKPGNNPGNKTNKQTRSTSQNTTAGQQNIINKSSQQSNVENSSVMPEPASTTNLSSLESTQQAQSSESAVKETRTPVALERETNGKINIYVLESLLIDDNFSAPAAFVVDDLNDTKNKGIRSALSKGFKLTDDRFTTINKFFRYTSSDYINNISTIEFFNSTNYGSKNPLEAITKLLEQLKLKNEFNIIYLAPKTAEDILEDKPYYLNSEESNSSLFNTTPPPKNPDMFNKFKSGARSFGKLFRLGGSNKTKKLTGVNSTSSSSKKEEEVRLVKIFNFLGIKLKLFIVGSIVSADRSYYTTYELTLVNKDDLPEDIQSSCNSSNASLRDSDGNLRTGSIYAIIYYLICREKLPSLSDDAKCNKKCQEFINDLKNQNNIYEWTSSILNGGTIFYIHEPKTLKDFTSWVDYVNSSYKKWKTSIFFNKVKASVGKYTKRAKAFTIDKLRKTAKVLARFPLYPYLNTLYKNVYVMPEGAIYAFEKRFPKYDYDHAKSYFSIYSDDDAYIKDINKASDNERYALINEFKTKLDKVIAENPGFFKKALLSVSKLGASSSENRTISLG